VVPAAVDVCSVGNVIRHGWELGEEEYIWREMKTDTVKRLLLLLLFVPLFSSAQKQGNIWYFGDHAGVNFNTGIPVALTDGATYLSLNHSEGTSTISDSSGILLFYTNGEKLWNKNHQVMQNGDSLLGNFSSTQSSIIIPKPASSEFYYVFTLDDKNIDNLQYGFRYSVVDICLNNGLGDIVSSDKNILLLDSVTEKVAAVKHFNNVDYWILTHKFNSDAFYSYLLTSNGIINTVITHIGTSYNGFQGQLKFFNNGNKIVMCSTDLSRTLFLFDFNKTTGIVSNQKSLTIPYGPFSGIYAAELSPDDSKLYCSFVTGTSMGTGIIQYNLNAGGGNVDSINSSVNLIYNRPNYGTIRALQIGIDGKIYMVSLYNTHYLCTINNPNSYGNACNFQDSSVYLGGQEGNEGLPTLIANFNYSNTVYDCTAGINEQNVKIDASLSPNPFHSTTTLHLNKNITQGTLTIYDTMGRIVHQQSIINQDSEIRNEGYAAGIYFYKVISREGGNWSGKVVIE
jgi:hypothetical protein